MILFLYRFKWAVDLASRTHKDISEVLSKEFASQKAINRSYLQKVLQNIIFLSWQGLPLRENWVPSADGDGGCELDSNFHQLILLCGNDDPNILDIMKQKTYKYTDHHIHDELMKIVACSHLSKIGDSIRDAGYFTLEADEVTDSSNKEELIICLRWVDNHFDPHEEFICLHDVDDTTADTIVCYLKDTVLRMNLLVSMCRAQCYDAASNMRKIAKEI